MRLPLRIAVLECDIPVDPVKETYGTYGDVMRLLLTKSAAELGGLNPETDLILTKWDVVNGTEYPNLDDIDAIWLTGSKHDSFDDIPWINTLAEYTKKAYDHPRVRIIGICFGHQIVGRVLGAPVGRSNAGWEVAVCNMDLTEKGKELFGKDKLELHQMHKDIVAEYPKDVVPLGSSPMCAVQGMYVARKLISVQGHPEFNGDITTKLVELRRAVFPDSMFQDALSRSNLPHDGVGVGAVFLKFLLEE